MHNKQTSAQRIAHGNAQQRNECEVHLNGFHLEFYLKCETLLSFETLNQVWNEE